MSSINHEIIVDSHHPLLNPEGMLFKSFPSDFRQVRYFGLLLVQKAPPTIREVNLLEQQITELLKNAVTHGNKNDISKKVSVWYSFQEREARLIVQDEGRGFQDLEVWNDFNRKRRECLEKGDFEKLMEYASFSMFTGDFENGGNALFAALEYWNRGVAFNDAKNTVGVHKIFPTHLIGRAV